MLIIISVAPGGGTKLRPVGTHKLSGSPEDPNMQIRSNEIK